jgi:hypothetical protein
MNRLLGRLRGFVSNRGPLPEVHESDWTQWEACIAASIDSDTAVQESDAEALRLVEPVEVDWATWEQTLQAPELP